VCPSNDATVVEHVLTADLHRLPELTRAITLIDFGRHETVEAVEDVMDLRPIGAQQWNRGRQLAERIDTGRAVLIT